MSSTPDRSLPAPESELPPGVYPPSEAGLPAPCTQGSLLLSHLPQGPCPSPELLQDETFCCSQPWPLAVGSSLCYADQLSRKGTSLDTKQVSPRSAPRQPFGLVKSHLWGLRFLTWDRGQQCCPFTVTGKMAFGSQREGEVPGLQHMVSAEAILVRSPQRQDFVSVFLSPPPS